MCVFRGSNYCDSALFPYPMFESKWLPFFFLNNEVPWKFPTKNIYILDFMFGSNCGHYYTYTLLYTYYLPNPFLWHGFSPHNWQSMRYQASLMLHLWGTRRETEGKWQSEVEFLGRSVKRLSWTQIQGSIGRKLANVLAEQTSQQVSSGFHVLFKCFFWFCLSF